MNCEKNDVPKDQGDDGSLWYPIVSHQTLVISQKHFFWLRARPRYSTLIKPTNNSHRIVPITPQYKETEQQNTLKGCPPSALFDAGNSTLSLQYFSHVVLREGDGRFLVKAQAAEEEITTDYKVKHRLPHFILFFTVLSAYPEES